eukprot:SAG31_NODE_1179_length_9530_cov_8.153748_3_plen_74_part_00
MPRVSMDVQTAVGYLMKKDTVTSTRLNCLVCLQDYIRASDTNLGLQEARPLLRAFAKIVAAGNVRVIALADGR